MMKKDTHYPTGIDIGAEHAALRQRVRAFADAEVAPLARQMDVEQAFPERLFQRLAEMGFAGSGVPVRYAGTFADYLSVVLIGEELARSSASVAVALFPHAILCAHNIWLSGTEVQKERYLARLAAGRDWGAMALAEAAAGSDILSMRTRATRSKGSYSLLGSKTFITNVPFAGVYLVFARTGAKKGSEGISAFIVEKDTPGFRMGKLFDKMGMRGSPTGRLFFRNCHVAAENLLGGAEGAGYRQLMRGMDPERVSWAAIALGIAQAAFDATLWYAGRRRQFGRTLDSFQMIKGLTADMSVNLQAARLLVYNAAGLLDRGRMARLEASSAKLFASEAAVRMAGQAVQVYGGAGYTKDYAVERYFRDAKVLTVAAGSSEIQRLVIAHEVKEAALGGGRRQGGAGRGEGD
jgi:alkylation response protein AidB-like acyl-CoA dehydrogenase